MTFWLQKICNQKAMLFSIDASYISLEIKMK